MKFENATISDMFDYSAGNHGLTEETVYAQQPISHADRIPVFSGSGDNETASAYVRANGKTKYDEPIEYFDGPCLILTKDGSAGLLTYKGPGTRFTINHHACVLRLKEKWKQKVDLVWFAQQFQSRMFSVATSKSDNRVFSVEWFDRLKFPIPKPEVQTRQRELKDRLARVRAAAWESAASIRALLTVPTEIPKQRIAYSGPIGKLFKVHGGNTGLTEETVYHNLPLNPEDSVPIRSGATLAVNELGVVSASTTLPNGKALRVLSEKCLLVTRKGFYAGTVTYWPGGRFAPNDDLNVLVPLAAYKDKINLQWFASQYAPRFKRAVSSLLHNPTFSSQWLSKITIEMPDRQYQDELMRKRERWHKAALDMDALAKQSADLLATVFPID